MVVGSGIWGLLAVTAVQLLRRTREVDVRRDALTEAYADHDRHVSDDRDALLVELRSLRAEVAALHERINRMQS